MAEQTIRYSNAKQFPAEQLFHLYTENGWMKLAGDIAGVQTALLHSETVVSAWEGETLIGLGNAISDQRLVVFFSHLLVLPSHQGRGIGSTIFDRLRSGYSGFSQQVLLTDAPTKAFYAKHGFKNSTASGVEALWVNAES